MVRDWMLPLGFSSVSIIEGGLDAWVAAGLPTSANPTPDPEPEDELVVSFVSSPDGCEVWFSGSHIGYTPMSVTTAPGVYYLGFWNTEGEMGAEGSFEIYTNVTVHGDFPSGDIIVDDEPPEPEPIMVNVQAVLNDLYLQRDLLNKQIVKYESKQ